MEVSNLDIPGTIDLLETGGLIAALTIAVFAMVRGWVWPKAHVDRVLEEQRKASEATAEIMAKEIGSSIEEGVARGMERGIAKGHLKINGNS